MGRQIEGVQPVQDPQVSFAQKVQKRKARRDRETELWKSWRGGNEASLGELYDSLTPIIKRQTMSFKGNLPEAYIDAMVKKHVLHALNTWDPAKAQMNTHILNRMHKVKREVSQYQNPGRLAEASHWKVPAAQNVQANLTEELGRDPTREELAHALGTSTEEAHRLRAGTRRDLSAIEGQNRWVTPEADQQSALLRDFAQELPPLEQQVLYMVFGLEGHPELQAKDIASKLGLTPGRVSQIRRELADKVVQRGLSSRAEKRYGFEQS